MERDHHRLELLELATGLGADVPVFLYGGNAQGTGTGTEIAPLSDAADKFLLVVKPNANISTSKAYEALKAAALTTSEGNNILSSSQRSDFSRGLNSDALQNDFDAVAFQLEPEIKKSESCINESGRERGLAGRKRRGGIWGF